MQEIFFAFPAHKAGARGNYLYGEGNRPFAEKGTNEMNVKTIKAALATALTCLASAALARTQNLPTPPPSPYPDAESSVDVPLANWPDLDRSVGFGFSLASTPSNAVQIALGQDANGNAELEPEETFLVLGCDCGEPFVREEVPGYAAQSSVEQSANPNDLTRIRADFALRQPKPVEARYDFARVTTRGRGESAAEIVARLQRPHVVLFVR